MDRCNLVRHLGILLLRMSPVLAPTLVILRNLVGSSTLLFFAPCTVFQPPSSTRWTPARQQTQPPSARPQQDPGRLQVQHKEKKKMACFYPRRPRPIQVVTSSLPSTDTNFRITKMKSIVFSLWPVFTAL